MYRPIALVSSVIGGLPPRSSSNKRGAERQQASQAYRSQAGDYDQRTDAFRQWRELLITKLPVQLGDTVLDVGWGSVCAYR